MIRAIECPQLNLRVLRIGGVIGMITWKRIPAIMLAVFLMYTAAATGEGMADAEIYTLIPEAEQRMRYDCVSFQNDWPEVIRDEMNAFFSECRVIEGIYYEWQALIGDPMPIVFAACECEEQKKLVGAWYYNYEWTAQIISDCFFRPDQDFSIMMKPDYNAEGRITLYQPAVQYDGEWFVFQPGGRGFNFSYYERERNWAEDCPDDTSMVIEIFEGRNASGNMEIYFAVSTHRIGDFKREIWRGRIRDSFDTDMIDASVFPTTIDEVWTYCEPNG